jgi:hypothetical protein
MKNKPFYFLYSLIFLMIVNACNKNSSDDFFAGKTEDIYYLSFNPELSLPQGNNKDSIDLNGDSVYELMFETLGIAGETGFFTLPAVRATKDLNILLGGEKHMPKALDKGATFNRSENWSKTDTLLALYYYPGLHSEPIGYWKDQQDKYLGFKYKNKLGWVKITTKVNSQLNQCLIIKELGVEK